MTNKKEFIHLIQEHKGVLNKVIYLYANNPEEKEDLRQEILLQAWRSYKNFRGEAQFSTWLYRIALNVSITFLRKKKLIFEDIGQVRTVTAADSGSSAELLQTILRLLGPVEKSIVLLTIEGYKQPEIAEMVGVSGENIRVKMHRIRKKLKEHGIKDLT